MDEGECYLCLTILPEFGNSHKTIKYPLNSSATWPVPHSDTLPIPVYINTPELGVANESLEVDVCISNDSDDECATYANNCQSFDQSEINDSSRDLGLSKELSELLASLLAEKQLLANDAKITYFRHREESF